MSKTLTVAITGASAGVGRATAAAFARRGASIGLIARGRAGLEGARRDVDSSGGRAMTVAAFGVAGFISALNLFALAQQLIG